MSLRGIYDYSTNLGKSRILSRANSFTRMPSGFFSPYLLEYLIIGGGGGGGGESSNLGGGGGGGAGGYRTNVVGDLSGGSSPAEPPISIFTGTVYTITVGSGGAGSTTNGNVGGSSSIEYIDQVGSQYIHQFIISSGGGGGGGSAVNQNGLVGGSGGGAGYTGNVGKAVYGQGTNGGQGGLSGGGGGSGFASPGIDGGDGLVSSIDGLSLTRGGGGGGGTDSGAPVPGTGGSGGGGAGGKAAPATAGTANTGGGGGGCGADGSNPGSAGGSGVVIIRWLTSYGLTPTTTGSPSSTTNGSYSVLTFNNSGTVYWS